MDQTQALYDFIQTNLVDVGFLTQSELDSTDYNVESLEGLLFYYTSWRDLNQAAEAKDDGALYSNM